MSFECEDFKKPIYQGTVTTTLKDIFGAESTRIGKSCERGLKFDLKKLNKFSEMYEASTEIKVMSIGGSSRSGITKHTITSRKSKIKPKRTRQTVSTVKMVSGDRQGSFLQSKGGNSRVNQAQKQSKNAKNSVKNRLAYGGRLSRLSRLSKKEKGVNY